MPPLHTHSEPISSPTDVAALLVTRGLSASTVSCYQTALRHFSIWCADHSVAPLAATSRDVAAYLGDALSDALGASAITTRGAAISKLYSGLGPENPTLGVGVRAILAGSRAAAEPPKRPITEGVLGAIVVALDPGRARHVRARALLIAVATGLRTGEIASLDVSVVRVEGRRLRVRMPNGCEQVVLEQTSGLTCPISALRSWVDLVGIEEGPIFRRIYPSGALGGAALNRRSVLRTVKEHVAAAGFDPDEFGCASLRNSKGS